MKVNRFFGIICLWVLVFAFSQDLCAQKAKQLFIQMPDSLLTLLTKVNREDCVDFLESKMKAVVENRLGQKSEMTHLTDTYIAMKLSPQASWQMKVLVLNDSTQLICTVTTVSAPASDSRLHFYTTDWHPLDTEKFVLLPTTVDSFCMIPDSTKLYEYQEARLAADMFLMKAELDPERPLLRVALATTEYMSTETAEKLKPFLRRQLVYTWKNGAFISDIPE